MGTLTLNLSDQEASVLHKLATKKDLSQSALMRQALRLYQHVDMKGEQGHTMAFVDANGHVVKQCILGLSDSTPPAQATAAPQTIDGLTYDQIFQRGRLSAIDDYKATAAPTDLSAAIMVKPWEDRLYLSAATWGDEGAAMAAEIADWRALASQPSGAPQGASDSHPDDNAVDCTVVAMKSKLAASRAKGRGGWDDPTQCTVEKLAAMLIEHVGRGDYIDVANFCVFLHNRGADHFALVEAMGVYLSKNAPYCMTPEEVESEMSSAASATVPQAVAVPELISVDERLPREGDKVICYRPSYGDKMIIDSYWRDYQATEDGGVTHWMPAPAIPTTPSGEA